MCKTIARSLAAAPAERLRLSVALPPKSFRELSLGPRRLARFKQGVHPSRVDVFNSDNLAFTESGRGARGPVTGRAALGGLRYQALSRLGTLLISISVYLPQQRPM